MGGVTSAQIRALGGPCQVLLVDLVINLSLLIIERAGSAVYCQHITDCRPILGLQHPVNTLLVVEIL